MSALHQREAGVDRIEDEGEDQADDDVRGDQHDRHGDARAGLRGDDGGDGEQLHVGRQRRQGGVLGEVEVLADHGWEDDPERLREDDQAEGLHVAEAQRLGRLPLPAGHGLDPAAHDLGDEAGGVDDQAQQEREIVAREGEPPAELMELRTFRTSFV